MPIKRRMTMMTVGMAAICVMLAGCETTGSGDSYKYPSDYSNGYFIAGQQTGCGARRNQYLDGQSSAALNAADLPYGTRMAFPNTPDDGYNSGRITVRINEADKVTSVECG